MALEVFKPFVIKRILDKELAYNIRGATRLIEDKTPEVWAILEEIVQGKLVLLNRAPTLHRLGVQSFQPVLIEGETIRIHPLVCEAFNADFDGDQMAVYLPLSEEAQREAKEIMASTLNLLRPANGMPIIGPFRDIALGCYYLTKMKEHKGLEKEISIKVFSGADEAITAYDFGFLDLQDKIKLYNPKKPGECEIIETTVGRIILNNSFPSDYPYINKIVDAKGLKWIIRELIEKYHNEECVEILDRIKNLGFEYSTKSGMSWGMDDLVVPPQKKELLKEAEKEVEKINSYYKKGLLSKKEKTAQIILIWQTIKSKLEVLIL